MAMSRMGRCGQQQQQRGHMSSLRLRLSKNQRLPAADSAPGGLQERKQSPAVCTCGSVACVGQALQAPSSALTALDKLKEAITMELLPSLAGPRAFFLPPAAPASSFFAFCTASLISCLVMPREAGAGWEGGASCPSCICCHCPAPLKTPAMVTCRVFAVEQWGACCV